MHASSMCVCVGEIDCFIGPCMLAWIPKLQWRGTFVREMHRNCRHLAHSQLSCTWWKDDMAAVPSLHVLKMCAHTGNLPLQQLQCSLLMQAIRSFLNSPQPFFLA